MIKASQEINDARIKAALHADCGYLYDSRRVEFHINAARTGGTFYDVVYKGNKRQRTKLAKWPAVSAKTLFDKLSAIRGNALADREAQLTLPKYRHGEEVLCWFMDFLDENQGFSTAYVATASSYIANHLLAMLDKLGVNAIDVAVLQEKFYLARQKGYALSTIKGMFGVLKKAFCCAYEHRLIARNPLKHITFRCLALDGESATGGKAWGQAKGLPHGVKSQLESELEKGLVRRFCVDDLPLLRSAIEQGPVVSRVFFTLQLEYGHAIKQVCLAEYQHFCREQLAWFVPATNSQNGQPQRLLVSPQTMALVDRLMTSDVCPQQGYVFSARGDKPISKRTLERWYQRLSEDMGIKFSARDMAKCFNNQACRSARLY